MTRSLATTALLFCLAACDSKPSDVREWRAADHDHTTEPEPTAAARGAARPSPTTRPTVPGVSNLTLTAWKNECVSCHGPMGRGDGPMGASLEVPDLTSSTTRNRSDQEISAVIEAGRGKMPGFDLPEQTRTELVRLLRLFGGARPTPPTSSVAPPPGAGPASSTAAPAPRASR